MPGHGDEGTEGKMRTSTGMKKIISDGLALLLAIPLGVAAANAQQQTTPPSPALQQAQPASAPGQSDQQSSPADQDNVPAAPGTQTSEPVQSPQTQNSAPQPLGTAIAPAERTMGVTASRPAGAVIAPAKQRRIRAIVIKIGVVVGAAVAVGTVVALSHGSPSQPH
jgi:hypothetical protein